MSALNSMVLLVALLVAVPVRCFSPVATQSPRRLNSPSVSVSSSPAGDGGEEDEAPLLEDDWRAFRARLIESGLSTTLEPVKKEEKEEEPVVRVSEENLKLVERQSPALAEEVMSAWAHTVGSAEVGGLLLRLPLELQLVVARDSYWGKKLRSFAASEESRRAMRDGVDSAIFQEKETPDEESPLHEILLYKVAGRFLKFELERISRKGKVDQAGRLVIDPRVLGEADKALLDMRQDYLDSWQEVVLVLDHGVNGSTGVAINRPAATSSNPPLSSAIVEALRRGEQCKGASAEEFDNAFRESVAAYVGCPNSRSPSKAPDSALVVHGIADLEGSTELAPGLGIYRGGSKAAIQRVNDNLADPLDFRFFIGSYNYPPGAVDEAIRKGQYRPVACSRSLALKQCLGLPKPLWHEVRLRTLSRVLVSPLLLESFTMFLICCTPTTDSPISIALITDVSTQVMDMLGGNSEEVSRLEYIKHRGDDEEPPPRPRKKK